jgi:hypothetical protein
MRLVVKAGADRCRENLLTGDKVTVIILDKYIAVSRCDLVLTVCEGGQDRLQLYTVDVTYTAYMPLHYVLLFLYGDPGWHYGL